MPTQSRCVMNFRHARLQGDEKHSERRRVHGKQTMWLTRDAMLTLCQWFGSAYLFNQDTHVAIGSR